MKSPRFLILILALFAIVAAVQSGANSAKQRAIRKVAPLVNPDYCPECPGGVCPAPPEYRELERQLQSLSQPAVDLAPQLRQKNWLSRGQGSCAHATTIMLLRWQGLGREAELWKQSYGGGEDPIAHERKLKEAGLRYVMTDDGDERLLGWAIATRRGCGVSWPSGHFVALVGIEQNESGETVAVILDNNRVGKYTYRQWDRFVNEWRNAGGWAVAFMGNVPPPIPSLK